MAREASGDATNIRDRNRWMRSPDLVGVLTGATAGVDLGPEAQEFLDRLGPEEVVLAGHPTLVIDQRGTRRIAPLVVLEFERGPGTTLVPAEDLPYLNPSVVNDDHFDDDACNEARRILNSRALFETSFDDVVTSILGALGLEVIVDTRPRPGVNAFSTCVITERSLMTRALLEELKALESRQDWSDTAAGLLFGAAAGEPTDETGPVSLPIPVNDAQEQAVEDSRREPLVVVTGPPGTGKSQFVATAVANAWMDGRTVLVSSTNNAAVDVAVERAAQIDPLLLLRTGNRTFRDRLPDIVNAILARLPAESPEQARPRAEHGRALAARNRVLELIERSSGHESELVELVLRLEECSDELWPDRPTPELDVDELWNRTSRLRRAWFFPMLRRRRLLRRCGASKGATFETLHRWGADSVRSAEVITELDLMHTDLVDAESSLQVAASELVETSRAAVVATAAATAIPRQGALSGIATARPAGPGLAAAISHALPAARGWATTALSVKPNLPLTANLFDLIVVDEASQCKVAEVIPLAYRARRLVIVGDPNQLNPVVRLDDRQLDRFAASASLDRSVLDRTGMDHGTGSAYLAFEHLVGVENVHLLDEHYRCHPTIARWFNSSFYGGRLHVLTDLGDLGDQERGLAWIDVEGVTERGSRGGARNRQEAEVAVSILADWLAEGETIGVVSPFAAQSAFVRRLAEERLGREALQAVDFESGTAHRFQGRERDIIVFSTVIAPDTAPGTAKWVESERNLLNVAASRARRALIILGHPTAARDLNVPTLVSLRTAAKEGLPHLEADWMVHSEAEKRLRDAMWSADLAPLIKPMVEGFELDFAFDSPGYTRLDIEVDGGQHLDVRGRQRRRDLARDAALRRLGWEVARFPAWRCLREAGAVVEEIRQLLERQPADDDPATTHVAQPPPQAGQ